MDSGFPVTRAGVFALFVFCQGSIPKLKLVVYQKMGSNFGPMKSLDSALTLERYELKYRIPLELTGPVCDFVQSYCSLDEYSRRAAENFYTINNLYLDTPAGCTLGGADDFSFNMRVRNYGESADGPCFAELKYKVRSFVKKKRFLLDSDNWAEILQGGAWPLEHGVSLKNLEDFLFMARTYEARPVLLSRHSRKAFVSNLGDGARVTVDRDLQVQEMNQWALKGSGEWQRPADETDILLELKWEKTIPLWMIELIRRFDLASTDFSKFACSLSHLRKSQNSPSVLWHP